ncbi:MAG: SUMF1/EgtB/PvdO family nonheme iron enzyme [Byssovorax sp.]
MARAPEAPPAPLPTVEAAPPPPAPAQKAEAPVEEDDTLPATLEEQRAMLFQHMERSLDLPLGGLDKIKEIVNASPYLGQGNPKVTKHPMKRSACRAIRREAGIEGEESSDAVCGRKNMVPVYNTDAGETPNDAKVCIDRFEFPDIACEYPVVYASAKEAAELCEAAGKRLCDAHEWEGACAGAIHPVEEEYAFGERRPYATWLHNKKRAIRWSYGEKKNQALCATQSPLTPGCVASGWSACGTNTYPAGAFPACKSPFGAYDLNGNAAEHMNLPLAPEELMSRGGSGATEMKGSWFIFGIKEAHEDDCRWRAKDWHPSKVMDAGSHRNYHLGFRCCMDVSPGQ